MYKLTEQQIAKAADAYIAEAGRSHPEYKKIPCDLSTSRKAIQAAAPFLQLHWGPPTEKERITACDDYCRVSMMIALTNFIGRRNAALLPKVDPRREKIAAIIFAMESGKAQECDKAADAILAALDEDSHG